MEIWWQRPQKVLSKYAGAYFCEREGNATEISIDNIILHKLRIDVRCKVRR